MTERILMRESTIIRMVEKSEEISRSLTRWGILMVLCIILLVIPDTRNILAVYVVACTLGIGSFIAISLGIVRVRGLQRLIPIEPEPQAHAPTPDPSDVMTFDQEHRPPATNVENQTAPNQISRVPYSFTKDQWWSLVRNLEVTNPPWKWNRKTLIRAKIFNETNTPGTSLTAPGHYGRVCVNFERAEIIRRHNKSWIVTEEGKHALCVAAGLGVIPT